MNIEQLIKKYEVRKDLLNNEHSKMLGLQLTPLKAIAKLLEDSYTEILGDINSLKQANDDKSKTEREALIAFCEWMDSDDNQMFFEDDSEMVDQYLKQLG